MKQNLKNLSLSFIITSIFSIWLYYLINLYDNSWTTIVWIKSNIQYLSFIYISIIVILAIYSNNNKKSKLILAIIILINFLYIIFSFWISNIWLNNMQWLFLLWFLILALISNYINNRFWSTITIFSIIGILMTIWSAIIPMYESGPDLKWFESQFSTKLIVYSKVNINKSKAVIKLDKKDFNILNWISSYTLKTNNSWSQLLFIADKKYLNTFWYILFPNKDIIQIYPQSAINIRKIYNKYQIEIITWTVKHNKDTQNNFYYFTGKYLSFGEITPQHTQQITDFYNKHQKEYILSQIWWDIFYNKTILNISKTTLEILSKILPSQFSDNIKNFNQYQKYIYSNDSTQQIIKFDSENINKNIISNISKSLKNTQIIK
jgi:hypothetical protein